MADAVVPQSTGEPRLPGRWRRTPIVRLLSVALADSWRLRVAGLVAGLLGVAGMVGLGSFRSSVPEPVGPWLAEVDALLDAAATVVLLAIAFVTWMRPTSRFCRGKVPWLDHAGWLVAAAPWLVVGAIFALYEWDRWTFGGRVESMEVVLTGSVGLLGGLYLLRATPLGDRLRQHNLVSRAWLGALAFGYVGIASALMMSSGDTPSTMWVAMLIGASTFLAPAWVCLLSALIPVSIAEVFAACPVLPLGLSRVQPRVTGRSEPFYAWLCALTVPWLIISVIIVIFMYDTLLDPGPGSFSRYEQYFVLQLLTVLPLYAAAIGVVAMFAAALMSAKSGDRLVNTKRRRVLLDQMRPALLAALGFAVLLTASSYMVLLNREQRIADSFTQLMETHVPYFERMAHLRQEANRTFDEARTVVDEANVVYAELKADSRLARELDQVQSFIWSIRAELRDRERVTLERVERSRIDQRIAAVIGVLRSVPPPEAADTQAALARLTAVFERARVSVPAWHAAEALYRSGQGPEIIVMSAIAIFLVVIVHYVLLVEVPFYWGQSRWQAAEVKRTEAVLRTAEAALDAEMASAGPGTATEATLRQWLEYAIARDRVRDAKEIPLHTVKSMGDMVKKGGQAGMVALAGAAAGPTVSAVLKAVMP